MSRMVERTISPAIILIVVGASSRDSTTPKLLHQQLSSRVPPPLPPALRVVAWLETKPSLSHLDDEAAIQRPSHVRASWLGSNVKPILSNLRQIIDFHSSWLLYSRYCTGKVYMYFMLLREAPIICITY